MKSIVILAGGVGARMANDKLAKQFLELNGTAIIIITLQNILNSKLFDQVYIVIHPKWRLYLEELLQNYEISIPKENIILGGNERLDSIDNALNELKKQGLKDDDKVIFHDAVRPFIDKALLQRALDSLDTYKACVAISPVKDTMIVSKNNEAIAMPNRNTLFCGQAPDGFHFKTIYECVKSLSQEEKASITGTAQIAFIKGIKVHTFLGDERNIKITTTTDLYLARAIYKELLK